MRVKVARAVQFAALHGTAAVDLALGQAATAGRFADGDLTAIIAHQATASAILRAGEQRTCGQGTRGWARHGGQETAR